jgi:phosphoglycolate phosphatase
VPKEKYPLLGERYKQHYTLHQHDISLFEGVLPMLHQLKDKQHLLAVATGKSRRGLDETLARDELSGMFDASRTADETAGKPHPLMLHELMAELGVSPERTLMVGDTTHDLQLALNAGCCSVGVSYGAHDHAAFEALTPLYVAHSVADLQQWLLDHG